MFSVVLYVVVFVRGFGICFRGDRGSRDVRGLLKEDIGLLCD